MSAPRPPPSRRGRRLRIEGTNRLPGPADGRDDGAVVPAAGSRQNRGRCPARRVLLDEVVRPELLAGRLVEREELASRSGREPIAHDQRSGVRSGTPRKVCTGRRRRIPVLPERLARRRVERDHDFFLAEASACGRSGTVHRITASLPRSAPRSVPRREGRLHRRRGRRAATTRQSGRGGHEVPRWSSPLRPVGARLRARDRRRREECDERQRTAEARGWNHVPRDVATAGVVFQRPLSHPSRFPGRRVTFSFPPSACADASYPVQKARRLPGSSDPG